MEKRFNNNKGHWEGYWVCGSLWLLIIVFLAAFWVITKITGWGIIR